MKDFFVNKVFSPFCHYWIAWGTNLIKEIPGEKSVLITIINISITAFILVVTLSIGPFEKISNSLSGRLYDYFLKNKKFRKPIITNLFLCLGQIIAFPFFRNCNLTIILYLLCLSLILLNAYKYSQAIKAQLDLTITCYPIIEEELKEEVKKILIIENNAKKNIDYAINDNRKSIFNALLLGEDISKYPLGNPYNGYDRIFIYKIHQIFDLIMSNIDNLKYSAFEMSIESLFRTFKIYLDYLNNHSISTDNVLLDFIDISKKILNKTKKNNNRLYSEIYIRSLDYIIRDIEKLNINKDYYYETLIQFYGDFIIPYEKEDIVIGLSRFERIGSIIFSQPIFLEFSAKAYGNYLKYYQRIIYKCNDISKVTINKVINSYAYETLINKNYLYNDYFFNEIIELLNSIDTANTIPIVDDYSTRIALLGKDKSIYTIIRMLLLDQTLETDESKRNLYKSKKIKSLIEILKRRYKGKGSQINSVISMLYNIYFDIFTLFDDFTFKLVQTHFDNWTLNLSTKEKEEYLAIMEDIFFFTLSNPDYRNDNICFSEFKLFFIALTKYKGTKAVRNYIYKNRSKLIKKVVLSTKISEKVKIEIYRIIKLYVSREYKKYFSKKIIRYTKKIKETNRSFGLGIEVEKLYDKEIFEIAPFFINISFKELIKKYINEIIFSFYLYKKDSIKKDILKMSFPIKIEDITKDGKITPLMTKIFIMDICEEGTVYLENNCLIKL